MSEKLRLVEVGPRDGLQNEAKPVPLEIKKEFIRKLLEAGVRELEAGAFVRPDKIPQMADSEKVLEGLSLNGATAYFLVPNEKGLERALASGVSAIACSTYNQWPSRRSGQIGTIAKAIGKYVESAAA